MKDEIKEIQERLDYHKAIGIEPEYCEDLITTGELQRLLDYITNLQEEVDKLTAESTEWEERTYCWQDRAENLEIDIDRANKFITEQKRKMYKSRNKIAMYILMKLEKILKGEE